MRTAMESAPKTDGGALTPRMLATLKRALPWAAVCRDCVRSAGGLRAERGGGGASNGGGAKATRCGAAAPPSLA